LKERLAANPSLLGGGLTLVRTEYEFASGDRVDILLKDNTGQPVTVEVEPEIPPGNYVGVWQAVKYKHLAAVQQGLPCEQVRSILAAPHIPDNVKQECRKLGVEPIEVPE
jgi:RecB family endonuclease NucS